LLARADAAILEAPLHMTIDKARELLNVQTGFGGFYNANSAKLILAEVSREHGQAAVDALIRECGLDQVFGFAPGTRFEGGLSINPPR
jgi:hypothetical protein